MRSNNLIAVVIIAVLVVIVLHNNYVYPLLYQDKIQTTQQLYTNYTNNLKTDDYDHFKFIINLKKYNLLINVSKNTIDENNYNTNLKINIIDTSSRIRNSNEESNEGHELIDKNLMGSDISINNEKLSFLINYNDILTINYNYIYNRMIIKIVLPKLEYYGRFKICCSNSPFLYNTPRFDSIRKICNVEFKYNNIFGLNEASKFKINDKLVRINSGSICNYMFSEFDSNYLLLNIINENWIIFFIVYKCSDNKYNCYIVIKNIDDEEILYCGCIYYNFNQLSSSVFELNIGIIINELKVKFFSEKLELYFNTTNVKNVRIDENTILTSIDMSIKYKGLLNKYDSKMYITSKKISEFYDLVINL